MDPRAENHAAERLLKEYEQREQRLLALASSQREQMELLERLIGWLRGRFEEQHRVSLEGNLYVLARLKEQVEQCKIALSLKEEDAVRIPLLAEKDGVPLALEEVVTRGHLYPDSYVIP